MYGYKPLQSLVRLIDNILERMLFRLGTTRTLHHFPVSVWVSSSEDEEAVFEKVDLALELIAHYAPEKFRSLKKDVSSIYVASAMAALGSYRRALKLVKLSASYVTDPETTHQAIACCLIHEAQHGRLLRLGFGYEESIRTRIEKICMTTERNFARKLPGCEALVVYLEDRIDFDWEPFISNEAIRRSDNEAKIEYLKDHDSPSLLIRYLKWMASRPRGNLKERAR